MNDGGLFQYLQSMQAYISPPIAAVFLLGVFSRRLNAYGAMAALITGFGLGVLRLALEASGVTTAGNALLDLYANSNFLHFAIFLFLVCSAVLFLPVLLVRLNR